MISRAAFLISPLWAEEEIIGSRMPALKHSDLFSFSYPFSVYFIFLVLLIFLMNQKIGGIKDKKRDRSLVSCSLCSVPAAISIYYRDNHPFLLRRHQYGLVGIEHRIRMGRCKVHHLLVWTFLDCFPGTSELSGHPDCVCDPMHQCKESAVIKIRDISAKNAGVPLLLYLRKEK